MPSKRQNACDENPREVFIKQEVDDTEIELSLTQEQNASVSQIENSYADEEEFSITEEEFENMM